MFRLFENMQIKWAKYDIKYANKMQKNMQIKGNYAKRLAKNAKKKMPIMQKKVKLCKKNCH